MHHTVTFATLLLAIGVAVGLAIAAIGALEYFAGGMSDNPELGAEAGRRGCFFAVLGLIIAGASIYGCTVA